MSATSCAAKALDTAATWLASRRALTGVQAGGCGAKRGSRLPNATSTSVAPGEGGAPPSRPPTTTAPGPLAATRDSVPSVALRRLYVT